MEYYVLVGFWVEVGGLVGLGDLPQVCFCLLMWYGFKIMRGLVFK